MPNEARIQENKLIILYALRAVNTGLTRMQLAELVIETVQFNYIDLMYYIDRMIKDQLINEIESNNDKKALFLTQDGRKTIDALSNMIPNYIRELLDLYIRTNHDKLTNELQIEGNVIEKGPGDFQAIMSITENGLNLMTLSINAPTKESGYYLTKQWKEDPQKFYAAIIHCFH